MVGDNKFALTNNGCAAIDCCELEEIVPCEIEEPETSHQTMRPFLSTALTASRNVQGHTPDAAVSCSTTEESRKLPETEIVPILPLQEEMVPALPSEEGSLFEYDVYEPSENWECIPNSIVMYHRCVFLSALMFIFFVVLVIKPVCLAKGTKAKECDNMMFSLVCSSLPVMFLFNIYLHFSERNRRRRRERARNQQNL
ncbi:MULTISPECIES: hypothetical protein [Candidatus Ichthyocystis]|uniref:Putative membrane protein n=1 Tax=Candidatus Ichthyocystis hellenicum TaxID=1561003 RepID=A0A0S4M176_9BURK|nr:MULTISPECIES: hypothetical protein [Ichthyocystis]CUT17393.1 putative membrane protein [Candidatus Ichthyocystis hellenicum]